MLKYISGFTGSAGFSVILRKKAYLFVDGRYTIQANIESGKIFTIVEIHKKKPNFILAKFNKELKKHNVGTHKYTNNTSGEVQLDTKRP